MVKNNHDLKQIWHSNFFTIFLLVLLIFSLVKVGKEALLRYEIKQEINNLEAKLSDVQGKTDKMNQLIDYLKTDEYVEKQAREKLNLGAPGEKQVNLANEDSDAAAPVIDNGPSANNIVKWFNYFFN
ncbi:MAG: septum formation initiator family protein [Patescibacteria group bacterium]